MERAGDNMRLSDKDILITVQALIDKRGLADAATQVAERIGHLRQIGDDEGVEVWRRILSALMDVSDVQFSDEAVH